jgi:hypothetical protein
MSTSKKMVRTYVMLRWGAGVARFYFCYSKYFWWQSAWLTWQDSVDEEVYPLRAGTKPAR